jgi:hypothetical protein
MADQKDTKGAKRRAVVIGINQYNDSAAIPTLLGAVNDAQEMAQRLRDFGDFDVPENHILLGERATSRNIRRAISDLLWQTDDFDMALLFFAGHGFADEYGHGYLAPHDMIKSEPYVAGIKMQELRQMMLDSKGTKDVVIILDCCFSGLATEAARGTLDSSSAVLDKVFAEDDETKKVAIGERVMIGSTGGDSIARERKDCRHAEGDAHPHGVYTSLLLEALDGVAANEKGEVYFDAVHSYVSKQLEKDNQAPRILTAGPHRLDQLLLCKNPKTNAKFVEDRVKEAREHVTGGPLSVIRAANAIQLAFSSTPQQPDVIEVRVQVEARLKELSKAADTWLLWYEDNIRTDCVMAWKELESAKTNLDLTKILNLGPLQKKCLELLCRISMEDITEDSFRSGLLQINTELRRGQSSHLPRSAVRTRSQP